MQMVAEVYRRMADREAELAITLRIQVIQPSPVALRSLARLYGELNRPAEQRRALQDLVASGKAEPGSFLDLVKLEAAAGRPGEGADLIDRLEASRPAAIDTSVVALQVALRLGANQPELGFRRAQAWLAKGRRQQRDVLSVASVFSANGQAGLAANLLGPIAERTGDQTILLAWSQAQMDSGKGAAALQYIERFADGHRGSVELPLAAFRLRLAAALNEPLRTSAAAEAMAPLPIPEDQLAVVAEAAKRIRRSSLVMLVLDQVAKTKSSIAPVVVAEVYLVTGDRPQALEWATIAGSGARDNPEAATRLAQVELRLMRKSHALAVLRSGLPFDFDNARRLERKTAQEVRADLLLPIARLYLGLDMAAEGYAVLQKLRQEKASVQADWAWALTAVAAGREAQVVAWLRSDQAKAVSPDFLRELIFLAVGKGQQDVPLAAAASLARSRGGEPDRLLLAELQASSGAPWVRPQAARIEPLKVVSR